MGNGKKGRKTVVYAQRVEIIESYGERRDCIDQRVGDFIYHCGFLPVALPNSPELAVEIVEEVAPAGIVLTGGNSLVKYGGNAPERDRTDAALLRKAVNFEIPVYGFCRGMQSILDYFGEELCAVDGHVAVRHDITGEYTQNVNSYHTQGCISLRKDTQLVAEAVAADGVIEAVRHKSLPIMGGMWHPERENGYSPFDTDRIRGLFGQ